MPRTSINKKTPEQEFKLQESIQLFRNKQYHASLPGVLAWLDNGTGENIQFTLKGNEGEFQLLQGPVSIKGTISTGSITAIAAIGYMPSPVLPVMRYLLELNLKCQHCRFSIDQTLLRLRFDQEIEKCSPDIMLAAMKELALQAEKSYWYFKKHFPVLQMEPLAPFTPCNEKEMEIKFRFFSAWIREATAFITDPSAFVSLDGYSAQMSISYMLLTTGYRIDYLLCPEGLLREEIKNFLAVFSNEDLSLPHRQAEMIPVLEDFANRSKEEIITAFYKPSFTFSEKDNNCRFDLLKKEINLMFEEANEHRNLGPDFIQTKIYEHPLLQWNFHYELPPQLTSLLHVLMQVNYPEYFSAQELPGNLYDRITDKCNAKSIQDAIQVSLQGIETVFPTTTFNIAKMNFNGLADFNHSFNNELAKLIATRLPGKK